MAQIEPTYPCSSVSSVVEFSLRLRAFVPSRWNPRLHHDRSHAMFTHPLRMLAIAALCVSTVAPCLAQNKVTVDHKSLQADLALPMSKEEAGRIAGLMIDWFGNDNIRKGPNPKIDGLNAAWAI